MSWGSEGGAEEVEKWCIWSSFLRARSWRIRAAHPTPHPNWESRPGTPLVIFLVVWGGARIPLGARVRGCTPSGLGPRRRGSGGEQRIGNSTRFLRVWRSGVPGLRKIRSGDAHFWTFGQLGEQRIEYSTRFWWVWCLGRAFLEVRAARGATYRIQHAVLAVRTRF